MRLTVPKRNRNRIPPHPPLTKIPQPLRQHLTIHNAPKRTHISTKYLPQPPFSVGEERLQGQNGRRPPPLQANSNARPAFPRFVHERLDVRERTRNGPFDEDVFARFDARQDCGEVLVDARVADHQIYIRIVS